MATVYNVMLYGGLALAIIFAIVAVIIFIVMKIPAAIGIVTGSTARKKIDEIREKGYESVQGGGASKSEAIKEHTSKISVRDVQAAPSARAAEQSRTNYEKAVADVERKRKQEEYLKEIREDATDVLHEDMQEMTAPPERDDDETDIIIAPHPNKKAAVEALKERQNSRKAPKQIHSDIEADSESATDVLRGEDAEDDKTTDILRNVNVKQTAEAVPSYEAAEDDSESATDVLRGDDSESATDVLRGDDSESATDVLRSDDADEATDVLREESDEEATDVLREESDEEATDVLREESDEEATDVLREESDDKADILQNRRTASSVKIIKNVIVVHSNEKI